jgi:hypothetical protein
MQSMLPVIGRIEGYMKQNKTSEALREIRALLSRDLDSIILRALLEKLVRFLEASEAGEMHDHESYLRIEQIVQAIRRRASVGGNMEERREESHRSREQEEHEMALELKHLSFLVQAYRHVHLREYGRAVQEVKRALVIRPESAEARELYDGFVRYGILSEPNIESPYKKAQA